MLWNYSCNGYTAEGQKVFYKNGQEVKREPIDSSYYMEGATVYKVGPNTDPATAREINENGLCRRTARKYLSAPPPASSAEPAPSSSQQPPPPASEERHPLNQAAIRPLPEGTSTGG